jgi:hypothetical protein
MKPLKAFSKIEAARPKKGDFHSSRERDSKALGEERAAWPKTSR